MQAFKKPCINTIHYFIHVTGYLAYHIVPQVFCSYWGIRSNSYSEYIPYHSYCGDLVMR
jgi:hypothetical protein